MSHVLAGAARHRSDGARSTAGIDPRTAIVASVAMAIVVVSLGAPGPLLGANGAAIGLALVAHLPLGRTLRRVAVVDTFMIVTLLTLPFTVAGTPAFAVGPWTASLEGLWQAAAIGLKTNAVLISVLALVGTLEPVTLGHALARLRLPGALVHVLMFTVRYVDVLGDEYRRLRTAMAARAFRPRNSRHTWRSYGYLVGMLLVRSVERAERVLAAMKCRGYTGRLHLLEDLRFGRGDILFAAVTGLLLAGLLAWDRLAFPG